MMLLNKSGVVIHPFVDFIRVQEIWFKVVECSASEVGQGKSYPILVVRIIIITSEIEVAL